jgi:hypothetical protein
MGTLKDTDRLSKEVKVIKVASVSATIQTVIPKSYRNDDYSF